jgi:hypothetical protein
MPLGNIWGNILQNSLAHLWCCPRIAILLALSLAGIALLASVALTSAAKAACTCRCVNGEMQPLAAVLSTLTNLSANHLPPRGTVDSHLWRP